VNDKQLQWTIRLHHFAQKQKAGPHSGTGLMIPAARGRPE
jgi:hypothetical protein